MKFSNVIICLVILANLLLMSAGTSAHQQKQTITTLLFNQRSGNLEVAHRFYIHDAEHAIKLVINTKADLMRSKKSQKDFGDYTQQHFRLRDDKGKPIKLNYVGHEVEGKFFWVYQEIAIPSNLEQLEIYNNMLREVWASQHNLVNIEGKGKRQSVEFFSDDDWKTVTFP